VLGSLWGNGKGKFRTNGKYSSATVRGTVWLTQDECDGTLTKVTRGTVRVRDLKRKKTVTVKAGHSYLARAQRAASKGRRR
jgi:ferric-dicitrate binding protein FerR (iron transport regulator)